MFVQKNLAKKERVDDFHDMDEKETDENCIMVIQVPLVYKKQELTRGFDALSKGLKKSKCPVPFCESGLESFSYVNEECWDDSTGMDMGNVQIGSEVSEYNSNRYHGRFVESKNHGYKRDPTFPV